MTEIIRMPAPSETSVLPATRLPVSASASRMARRHDAWRPRFWILFVTFPIVLAATLAQSVQSTGPLGPIVTVLWTYPIIGTLVGLWGAWITRRRLTNAPADDVAAPCPDRLVVVVPTIGRHDTYPALERAVRSYITYLPECFPRLRVDVVIEEGCEAAESIAELGAVSRYIRVVTVPRSYRTPNGTRFKSRANHYVHELRLAQHEDRDDVWILHMDDDTGVGLDTAVSMANFIRRQRAAGADGKHLAQGILTYPRENARNRLTWLADALRPVADVTTFSAFTGNGTPLAGVHGELLLVRASVEAQIGWDFGPDAIVEDAQFALIFSRLHPGRSAWFPGRCYGASPASVRDFLKQRERWAWGLVGLAFNANVPLRDRLFIGYSVLSWMIGPFGHIGFVLLLGAALGSVDTVPITLAVLPIWALNMAYAVWLYWEGLRMNVAVSQRGRRTWWEGLVVIALIPVFALMEGIGGLRGLYRYLRRTENTFVVIAKPA
ncbi:cellulose synthase/poly-beta-1,6-N-acetylglucosamine synthase-like glycosyltransferase [Krasilnikovia cinnamomea]|uniref:Cellulose synthase/poly-beta-1,6-N-acetylglucosamine synthase-like glycosyltransferase n=2 Tax=Krasilnikovia cinnamomea TaxID=349313 RepID=A0A4Q7ZEB6_9ACTN|nr:cellulose synthase/poly-beta-1,6-N-acetylglucosamine synthase-like glycosyltransferase [Krasilnikovia cinnamomea]